MVTRQTAPTGNDLDAIVSSNAEVEILHPATGEKIGLTIELRPIDSPEVRRMMRRVEDEAQRLRVRGKFIKAEEVENNTIEIAVAAISSWKWGNNERGEPLTWHNEVPVFNLKNGIALLTERPWILSQIDGYLSDNKRFFRN